MGSNMSVVVQNFIQRMSSREISILCNKRHDNVCRDVEKLNETYLEMGLLKIEEGYYTHPNTGNQQLAAFTKKQNI